jgi:crotonobetainyl-CoA:carnitine CoA-transferase CaiB-like acyl-CoA transferase
LPESSPDPFGLLEGTRVLDLSIWRPGPYATSLLCHLGADVLKVEPPGGDPMRHYPELFDAVNAGKRSIELNLKDPDDRNRAWELALEADVVVEGFRPGVLARFGLDAVTVRAARPEVVYCSLSGFGQQGDLAAQSGHDVNYQAWAGSLSPEGQPAAMPPLPIADLASGLAAAMGICAALLGRQRGGVGTYLDVSMTDVVASWTGAASSRTGDQSRGGAPAGTSAVPGYGLFSTSDSRQVALGVVSEQHFWSGLCAELGLDDVADLDFAARSARGVELNGRVADAIVKRERDDLVTALSLAGVPAAPVLDRQGMVARGLHPDFPIRLTGPANANATHPRPVPHLNEHAGTGFRS